MPTLPQPSAYFFLLLGAIVLSGVVLWRLRRRDADLLTVYLITLAGAFLGAKVVYLLAEGWMYWDHTDRWQIWLTGKTILGALLFGYPAAELGKKFLGYQRVTGDWIPSAAVTRALQRRGAGEQATTTTTGAHDPPWHRPLPCA